MSRRPCPGCSGTGAITIPTAHRQRPPTPAEVVAFARGPRRERWRELPKDWNCPGCGRTKVEILRWGRRPGGRWGWTAAFATHHDHGAPCGSSRAELLVWGPKERHPAPRFPPTVICAACNAAEDRAKRSLGLPERFSFSAREIRLFVTATPHAAHRIDYEAARRVWEEHVSLWDRKDNAGMGTQGAPCLHACTPPAPVSCAFWRRRAACTPAACTGTARGGPQPY